MAGGRKVTGKVKPTLWRPTRAIRNFLALHSLRYKTNKVGGVDIRAATGVIWSFGRNVSDERVLAMLRARRHCHDFEAEGHMYDSSRYACNLCGKKP